MRRSVGPPMIGKTLAHYEIEGRLGEGGSGIVYRGRDLRLERPVAIKVLADALRDDELAWARLLREARLASQLNHPNIAAIYDLGEEDGRAYIVMELVEGLPLADLIPEGGMPAEQVRHYVEQVASALAFAHEHGTIHGDLKGSNIVVTPEGNIKLLDFGLGRRIPRNGREEVTSSCLPLAESGVTAGTLPYLAPEVLRGGPSSVQSDVWALGVLLYQMATGDLPFQGATSFELSVQIMVGKPPKLEHLPEPLQALVQRCLEKDPAARISPAGEVASALQQRTEPMIPAPGLADEQVMLPPQRGEITGPRSRRGRWIAALLGFCVLLSGSLYARHRWLRGRAPQAVAAAAPKSSGADNPDAKVWVNTDSGTYHCPGSRWYGKTQTGEFMTQKQAEQKGYRPASKRACM